MHGADETYPVSLLTEYSCFHLRTRLSLMFKIIAQDSTFDIKNLAFPGPLCYSVFIGNLQAPRLPDHTKRTKEEYIYV